MLNKLAYMSSLSKVWLLVLEKEKSEFKPVKICLKMNPVS